MPVPVINYAVLPPAQYGLDLSQIPKGLMEGIQAYYMPKESAADLQQKQLANALSKIQLQYAPQTAEADLAYKLAQSASLPYQAMGSYYGGLGRYNYSNWSQSPNSMLIRTINTPQMQNLIANNPQVAAQVATALGNIGTSATGLPPGAAPLPVPQQMPVPQNVPLTVGQQDINNMANAGIGYKPSAQDIQGLQQATGNVLNKKTIPSTLQNQRLYSQILDNLIDRGDELMPNVSKFSGLGGEAKKFFGMTTSASGSTSPEYSDYLNFTRVVGPQIANEMRRVLGGQATDHEQKLMASLANPTGWNVSPKQAMSQWNELKSLYRDKVNPVLAKSPNQIAQSLGSSAVSNSAPASSPDPLGLR